MLCQRYLLYAQSPYIAGAAPSRKFLLQRRSQLRLLCSFSVVCMGLYCSTGAAAPAAVATVLHYHSSATLAVVGVRCMQLTISLFAGRRWPPATIAQPVAKVLAYLHVQISPISCNVVGSILYVLGKNTDTAIIVGYRWTGVGENHAPVLLTGAKKSGVPD